MSEINETEELPESIFPVNLKWTDQYQRKDPSLMDKYLIVVYQTDPFRGGSNIFLNLITCKDNIIILLII